MIGGLLGERRKDSFFKIFIPFLILSVEENWRASLLLVQNLLVL